ncbi:hypothetical protein ADK94_06830 [Streptomyces sp. XY593]|nr:hypothetical protein ADK94_06830 [Streptomyces sp. XY593]KOU96483.1 hypothetical protein ADK92_17700 [Streptomyces sp. XY533]
MRAPGRSAPPVPEPNRRRRRRPLRRPWPQRHGAATTSGGGPVPLWLAQAPATGSPAVGAAPGSRARTAGAPSPRPPAGRGGLVLALTSGAAPGYGLPTDR